MTDKRKVKTKLGRLRKLKCTGLRESDAYKEGNCLKEDKTRNGVLKKVTDDPDLQVSVLYNASY
jgi:hypothetical protein